MTQTLDTVFTKHPNKSTIFWLVRLKKLLVNYDYKNNLINTNLLVYAGFLSLNFSDLRVEFN
jgi:hypothetical protein